VRVLHLLTSTAIGGGPRQVYDLVTRLPGGEFTPLATGPRDGAFFDMLRGAGVPTIEMPLNRVRPLTLGRVVRMVRAQRADVVHSHGKGAGLYGRLAAALAGVPAVHTFHGIHHLRYTRAVDILYLRLERALSRLTDVIINVSWSQAREGIALELFHPSQSVVIVNGVDGGEIRRLAKESGVPRQALGLGPGHLVMGCLTRFDPVKRTELLLEAVVRLRPSMPGLHLVLAGAGEEERSLRQRALRAGIVGDVTFLNFLPRAPRLLPALDLYVSASRREGLPLAVLEAMAAGLPVVATRVPGHVDVVEDGVTGLLADPDDPADLAGKAAALLTDADRRAAMGAAARRRVTQEFGIDRMVAETAAVYRDLVARGGRRGGAGTV
jgi:glycosyltransferase involved in cell wall biosynthesis